MTQEDALHTGSRDVVTDLFQCADCDISYLSNPADYGDHLRRFGFEMRDHIWEKMSIGNRLLCLTCAEKRLGRALIDSDFTILGNPKFILRRYESLMALSSLVDLSSEEQMAIGRCLAIFDRLSADEEHASPMF